MAGEMNVYNMLQEIVAEYMSQNVAQPEAAVVRSIDPDNYTVMAELLYDEGLIIGPLRICESYAGNSFGITAMPKVDDEVLVIFQGGKINDGYVVGRLYGPDDPPAPFTLGDWKLTHESGAIIKIDAAGNVTTTAKGGAQQTLAVDGTITSTNGTVTMELKPTGEVSITNGQGTIDMNAAGQFAIKNATGADLLTILDTLLNDMVTAAPTFAGIYPMNPTLLAAITALELQVATLKQ